MAAAQGGARAAVLGLGNARDARRSRALARGRRAGPAAGGRLEHRDCAACAGRDSCGARLGARQLSFRQVSHKHAAPAAAPSLVPPQLADMAYVQAHGGGARDGARHDQHAGGGPDARAPGRRWPWTWPSDCGAQGRVVTGDALREGFPAIHAVGRAAECAPRLIDFSWGDPGAPRGDAGRQGRLLRFRRPRHQGAAGHAADEEGHGRRGLRARARARDHGERAAGAAAGARAGRREFHRGQCLSPG